MSGSQRNNGGSPVLPFPRPRRTSSILPMDTISESLGDLSVAPLQASEKDESQERDVFVPGLIFSSFIHTEDDQENKPLAPKPGLTRTRVSEENGGRGVCTKYRKFVVIATYGNWFTALPIFTFNGEGLAKKHRGADEFVSIRDVNRPPHAPPESRHPSLFCAAAPALRRSRDPWNFMTPHTVVALTHPVTFRYQMRCTLMGAMQAQGTADLVTLFHDVFLADVRTFLTSRLALLGARGDSILGKTGPVVDGEGYRLPRKRRASVRGGGEKYRQRPSVAGGAGSVGSGYDAGSVRGGVRTVTTGSKAADAGACFKCGQAGHVFKQCLAIA